MKKDEQPNEEFRGGADSIIQYAALPLRRNADSQVEVMLVTSRERVIPKGWPIGRKAPHASAAREALEEARVVGAVGRESIGTYSYEKRMSKGVVVVCEVRVFPLEVKRQMKGWPEKEERTCCWFSPTEAAKVVHGRTWVTSSSACLAWRPQSNFVRRAGAAERGRRQGFFRRARRDLDSSPWLRPKESRPRAPPAPGITD